MVSIGDVVNSESPEIHRQLAGGLTIANLLHGSATPIGGQNAVIKLRLGSGPEGMKFKAAPPGIKFALGENVKQSNWGEKKETRFVIVSKQRMSSSEDFDKASIKFSLSHKTGSLASVLTILRDYNLNLTKIQSLPIIEFPWKYSFFIDTTFNDMNDFNNAIELIGHKSESLKLLGIYKNRMK